MKKDKSTLLRTLFIGALLTSMSYFTAWSQYGSGLQAATAIKNLRTEYQKNPIGIDATTPKFSWEIQSDKRGTMQKAYQISISTDKAGSNVVWNSGVVPSDQSVNIKYAGSPLSPSTRYYWSVNVWDNKNVKVKSTDKTYFETGLLDSGWSNAQWIKIVGAKDTEQPVSFTLEMDMTLINDNAGIIFGAKDLSNMYMWAINTHDNPYPILRRHVYKNGNPNSQDVSLQRFFKKEDLLGKEHHLKIEVKGHVIYTYIGNTLVDTYTSENLVNGYFGFRVYNGNNTNEMAYFDNIVFTSYAADKNNKIKPTITFSENFENGSNDFEGTETVVVNGNTKINISSRNGDFRVLQGMASGIPMFRTEFALKKQIQSARIYSSGLGVYNLFINGKRVGTPMADGTMVYDELNPGWTDYRKTVFYNTYDVTGLLTIGQNAIGSQVSSGWLTGEISHGEYGNAQLGFIAKLVVTYTDGTKEIIVTDPNTWASSTDSAVRLGDIYNGESYDARKESRWTSAGFDASAWNKTTVNNSFHGEITAFVGPPVQVRPRLNREPQKIVVYDGIKPSGSTYGEINITNTIAGAKSLKLKKGETAIYDLGQNIVGWVKFKVKGDAGAKMRIRFAEMLNDSGEASRRNDAAKGTLYLENLRSAKATLYYTLKGSTEGETFNPSTTFFGFRYCEVTATKDIEIESITGEVVGSVTEEKSSLTTSHKDVNQLYSNVIWGQRGNFLSIPTDCPQRDERLGWAGDTQIFSRAAAYNADVATFFHKWMGDMRDGQREDGAYPDVAPHSWVGYGQSAWADAGIIVPWNIYLAYGDKDIIKENYAWMEKYMGFLANQSGDGYKYNGGNTNYGDWLAYEKTDSRYVSVCYYAYVAELMAKLSAAISTQANDIYAQNSEKYQTLYNNIKAEFETRYVNPDGTLKETSQTAYLLALKLDLFPSKEATKNGVSYLVQKIADNGNKLSTGFVGTGTLNQTLSQFGATGTAYNLLLQRQDPSWLYSVDQGATTIWERWNSYTIESGFGEPSMNSFNHYSYGAVSEWMYRFMAGIETDERNPGFKHIILQPNPDTRTALPAGQERIMNVDATYASYYGNIRSAWTQNANGTISYTVSVPPNTIATLYLPKLKTDSYVYENKIAAEKAEGIMSVKEENNKFVLELQSGNYSFEVVAKN